MIESEYGYEYHWEKNGSGMYVHMLVSDFDHRAAQPWLTWQSTVLVLLLTVRANCTESRSTLTRRPSTYADTLNSALNVRCGNHLTYDWLTLKYMHNLNAKIHETASPPRLPCLLPAISRVADACSRVKWPTLAF